MPNKLNLMNKKFGYLTVIKEVPNKNNRTYWLCQCDCGNLKEIRTSSLTSGVTTSCGKCDLNKKEFRNPNISTEEKIKICPICQKTFSTNINNRIYCYDCSPSQDSGKFRKRAVKHQLILYKGGKCEKCGYNNCEGALQFHHIDPSKKEFILSEFEVTKFCSLDDLKREVDKCQLLCANCHAEVHYND